MGAREASKHLSLERLLEIKDNQYRSKCGWYDYQPEFIDNEIVRKQAIKSENEVKDLIKKLDQIFEE